MRLSLPETADSATCDVCPSAGILIHSWNDVVHGNAQDIGQPAQSANRSRASTSLDPHDLDPIDAGRAGEIRLSQISELSPNAQWRLSIDQTVYNVGRNQLLLAAADPRLYGQRRSDIREIFFQRTEALVLDLGDRH